MKTQLKSISLVTAVLLSMLLHCSTEAKQPKNNDVDLQVLNGKFSPDKKANFREIPAKYLSGRKQFLDDRALEALLKLAAAAHDAGFDIQVVSATRTFSTQKIIWEEKFSGARKVGGRNLADTIKNEEDRALEILRFSSMPGTSRHHWGTDLDLHEAKITAPALHNDTFKKGRGKEFYNWLVTHAPRFGFCQPYTGNPSERNGNKFAHGYQEERWHWSYKPVAMQYLQSYQQNTATLLPKGYAGDKAAAHFYMDYVQNIDPECTMH